MNIFIAGINGNSAELTPEESWHCAKVLRKKVGETIRLIDGHGGFYEAKLNLVNDKCCVADIIKREISQREPQYYLHLAIAPTKQIDRIEWMLEKAVEIGIQEISFFVSHHSERKAIKIDRIQKIVLSAVKQSLQSRIPKVNELVKYNDILSCAKEDQKFIAHCYEMPKKDIREISFKNKSTLILVGPEGDFSQGEIEESLKFNFEPVHLGKNRLRSETAGLYVCQAAAILTAH